MKPIDKWTPKQRAIFLNELTGNNYSPYYYFDNHDGFFTVKDFMETHLPEVWEKYLATFMGNPPVYPSKKIYKRFSFALNKALDLDNLLTYLLDNTDSWGWKEVYECGGDYEMSKVKHPALLYAESLKEEPCEKR